MHGRCLRGFDWLSGSAVGFTHPTCEHDWLSSLPNSKENEIGTTMEGKYMVGRMMAGGFGHGERRIESAPAGDSNAV